MSRISRVLWAFMLTGVAAMATAETVYKWVDASGQVHFTDVPPRQGDARIIGIYQQEAGIVDDQGGDEGNSPGDGEDAADAQPATQATTPGPPPSKAAVKAAEADAAKAKVEQCKAAQDRYQRYIESRRLFRETPDGEREYLSEKELSDARANARQAVDDYCN